MVDMEEEDNGETQIVVRSQFESYRTAVEVDQPEQVAIPIFRMTLSAGSVDAMNESAQIFNNTHDCFLIRITDDAVVEVGNARMYSQMPVTWS